MKKWLIVVLIPLAFSCKKQEEKKEVPQYKVKLEILMPDARQVFEKEYTEEKTVYEILTEMEKENLLSFEETGKGDLLFLESLNGIRNEGLGEEKKNWLYFVDSELAKEGMAQMRVKKDTTITWCYTSWKEKENCVENPKATEGDPHDQMAVPSKAK